MKYLCGILLLTVLTAVNSQLKWMKITNQGSLAPNGTRDCGFGYDAVRHQLIMYGGRPGPKDETWIYNLTSDTWRMINSTPKPPPRFSFVSGIHGDNFYIAMGEGPSKMFYNDIWKFDLITEKWEEMPAQTRPSHISESQWRVLKELAYRPLSRYGVAGGIHPDGSHLIFHAGFADRRYFDTNSYDLNNPGWTVEHCPDGTCNPYNPSYPHARCLHAGTMVSADELAIFGGCLTGGSTLGPCPAGDSWIFNRQTSEWKRLDGCPSPKMYTTMAMLPSLGGHRRAVLYGGRERSKQVIETTDSGADEVAVLDPESGIWTLQKTDAASEYPVKRLSSAMATGPDGIYMFGGNDINRSEAVSDLWILLGNAETAKNAATIPCPKHFINYILLHGIFMVAGWGVFLTWGAFIARYFNSTGKLWFYMHVSFQVFGLILAICGLAMGIKSVQFGHTKFIHGAVGAVVMVLGILQPCNALVRPDRPKEGEPRSFKRKVWEFIHHFGGRIAIILALINISLGVFAAIATKIIWILWFVYVGILLLVFIIAEYVKGCFSDQRLLKRKRHDEDTDDKPQMAEHGENHNGKVHKNSISDPPFYKSSRM